MGQVPIQVQILSAGADSSADSSADFQWSDRKEAATMFEMISYEKFRDTPNVRFFNITVPGSNARDLVYHDGPAISPNNTEAGHWQFYLHPGQEDNLLALSGGRTFFLVNFAWEVPFHIVRLEANGDILRIPPGTFHRSVSDPGGSLVINQAVRKAKATVQSEFRVYNSGQIPRLWEATVDYAPPPQLHGLSREGIAQPARLKQDAA